MVQLNTKIRNQLLVAAPEFQDEDDENLEYWLERIVTHEDQLNNFNLTV